MKKYASRKAGNINVPTAHNNNWIPSNINFEIPASATLPPKKLRAARTNNINTITIDTSL